MKLLRSIAAMAMSVSVLGAAVFAVTASHAASGESEPVSAFFIDSEPGSFVGRSATLYAAPPTYQITATFDATAQSVFFGAFRNLHDSWSAYFRAPSGQQLVPGDYEAAVDWPGGGSQPSLDFSSSGRGCTGTGRFTIKQIQTTNGELTRFAASFEQMCGDRFVFGETHYNSLGVDLPALIESPKDFEFGVPGATQVVTLTNPGNVTQAIGAVIHGLHSEDFRIAANDCSTLAPGASCEIDVVFEPVGKWSREGHIWITDSTRRGHRAVTFTGEAGPTRSVALDASINPLPQPGATELRASVIAGSGTVEFEVDGLIAGSDAISGDGQAALMVNLSAGEHWVIAIAHGPGYSRSESAPLLVVVSSH